MEVVTLDAALREKAEVGKNNKLRKSGFVPAVVYGEKMQALALKIERSRLIKFMHAHHGGENVVITLRVAGGKKAEERSVLISEIQKHPVSDEILHVDFHEIDLTERIEVQVPIEAKGEAVGVKQDGGVLEHILWEIEVECLPTQIPEKLEVDISALKIGDEIHVRDLKAPEGVVIKHDPEALVISLLAPREEEPVAAEGAEAEGAPAEPEVIKKEKKVEDEAAEAEAPAEKEKKEKK
ncbi:MAG: 50S ribosomal protein L25/general stress protein Ctc [Deltaproteobacteria bacterium]